MRETWLERYGEAAELFGSFLDARDMEAIVMARFPAGTPLMEEDSYDDSALYYILEGVAEGRSSTLSDVEEGLYYVPIKVGRGGFTGFFEAAQEKPTRRKIGIYAKTDVVALKISQGLLYRWARFKPELLLRIFSGILTGSWKQRDVVSNVSSFHSGIKLAVHLRYLYNIYLRSCYPPGYTGGVRIVDTHRELGYATGCSIRTIDRCITRLEEAECLTLRRGKIYIDAPHYEALLRFIEQHS